MIKDSNHIDKQFVLNNINDEIENVYQAAALLEKISYPDNVMNDDDETFYINAHKELKTEYKNLLTVRAMVNQWPDEGLSKEVIEND